MLTSKILRRAHHIDLVYNGPGVPVPRDHLPNSWYVKREAERVAAEQRAERAANYVPGHTRNPTNGQYISREAYINRSVDAMIDGMDPKYARLLRFSHDRVQVDTIERRVQ